VRATGRGELGNPCCCCGVVASGKRCLAACVRGFVGCHTICSLGTSFFVNDSGPR
jgi:hypothetical protein